MGSGSDKTSPHCNICGCERLVDMQPTPLTLFTRKNVQCDNCLSLERHRLLFELLQTTGRFSKNQNVLHFAPEPCLYDQLSWRFGNNYRACDLDPARYADRPVEKIDLCNDLPKLEGQTYDIVIHNHVMEHLYCSFEDVLRQLDQLICVGGLHIFTLPFMLGGYRECLADLAPEKRIDRFGQHDHVRVFSPEDFAEVIARVFDPPARYDATRLFSPERLRAIGIPEHQWFGFHNNSLLVLKKKAATRTSSWVAKPLNEVKNKKYAIRRTNTQTSALLITGEGPSKGHLVRTLAVGEQFQSLKPVFLTMSEDVELMRARGHQVHHVPHHSVTGENPERWHRFLACEIELIMSLSNAEVLIYDLNFVFDGVIEGLRQGKWPGIWLRRGMWPKAHEPYIGAGTHFKTIIEPGDLAASLDQGPTSGARDGVASVPPILLTAPDRRLSRSESRKRLGIEQASTVIAVDLGNSQNPRYQSVRTSVLTYLRSRPGVDVIELRAGERADSVAASAANARSRRVPFHAYSYSAAWDALITRPGYNTFHEVLFGNIPTLFVPDTSPDMDRQDLRAEWASQNQCALKVELNSSEEELFVALKELLDHERRQQLSLACSASVSRSGQQPNGAQLAARVIEDLVLERQSFE